MRLNLVSLLVLPVAFTASLAVAQNSSLATQTNLHAAVHAETGKTGSVRISTGVLEPKLLSAINVKVNDDEKAYANSGAPKSVVVAMTVDEKGLPHDVTVVRSLTPSVDAKVVAALASARFQPATLDAVAVAVPMTMTVVLK